MEAFFNSLISILVSLFFPVLLFFITAVSIVMILDSLPFSKRKLEKENAKLQEQHEEDCKKMQEMEQYKTEGEKLYNVTLEKLQKTTSADVPKMLESVITGRLNNAFESNLSLHNFHAEIKSPDSNEIRIVTLNSCTCPDHTERKIPCKHMLYLAYTLGVLQVNEKETQAKYWLSVQRINENAEKIKEQEKQIKKNKNKIQRQEQRIEKQKAAARAAEKINKL